MQEALNRSNQSIILEVSVRGTTDKHVFRFSKPEITIGRLDDNELLLAHSSVDERHARLLARDGRFIIVDLKSQQGTFVNQRRIVQATIVREGDVVSIGAYQIGVLEREPPIEQERHFLDAIEKSPNDDDTRTVYCDWLEEQGRHEEADFVRAQLSLKNMAPEHPHFHQLSAVIEATGPRLASSWRRTIARPPIEKCPIRFELQCPKKWDALEATDSPDERFCNGCKKNVHFASTVYDARRLALAGHCVAVDIAQSRYENDLEEPPQVRMAGMIAPPLPPPARPPLTSA